MALLSAAVVAEGAFLARTRSRVSALEAQLQVAQEGAGAAAASDDGEPRGQRPALDPNDAPAGRPVRAIPGLPPPRFVAPAPAREVPLPAMLENPESREKLRAFVAAELQRERD